MNKPNKHRNRRRRRRGSRSTKQGNPQHLGEMNLEWFMQCMGSIRDKEIARAKLQRKLRGWADTSTLMRRAMAESTLEAMTQHGIRASLKRTIAKRQREVMAFWDKVWTEKDNSTRATFLKQARNLSQKEQHESANPA